MRIFTFWLDNLLTHGSVPEQRKEGKGSHVTAVLW